MRRTYSLGAATVQRFEAVVPPGQRSQVMEELLEARLLLLEEAKLRQQIEEGLAYMAEVIAETDREWSVTERDGWPSA